MKLLIYLILLTAALIHAQEIQVVQTEQLPINNVAEALFPKFCSDNSKILYTTANYKGLYIYDIDSKKSNIITDENGAGYNPLVMNDDKIIFRTVNFWNGRKYNSAKSFEMLTNRIEIFEENKRALKIPHQTAGNELLMLVNNEKISFDYDSEKILKPAPTKAVYSENNNLILVEGAETKILNPLGKGVYVWESLSADGNNIIFTYGNKGAFICDLEGNIKANIENAHFPKFSPNGKFVSYMVDKDNGYTYTTSDIYIYSVQSKRSYTITNSKDRIEMYAEWSNDGNRLVYHTTEGKIFHTTLKFEN